MNEKQWNNVLEHLDMAYNILEKEKERGLSGSVGVVMGYVNGAKKDNLGG